ncbi:MAG: tetratricopeptide repeat protein [Gammaproteobacteria bacterium]|nr:tetratricopeptide repeat protein [Gammaproteobacteria bacterium]MCW8910275.1 tetratricopeptide repeat protein [Gammaproteobacteria bacterium]MCW9005055.1 tetratricopeptide repeat protein [Gammaproteobacteria bacterium]MCW9056804.1 tetratricopeptide repeat protein [Gammaproteobacteria bacterium]
MMQLNTLFPAYRFSAVLLLLALLMGCETSPFKESVEGPDIARVHEFSEDLLYELLVGEFAGISGDLDESAEHYLQAAEQSNDPQVVARAAHIALYAKRYADVIDICERWRKVSDDESAISRIETIARLQQGEIEQAIQLIESVVIVDGQVLQAGVGWLSHVLKKESTAENALQVLERLSVDYPDQAYLLLLQARFEASAKNYGRAMQSIDRVIQLAPEISDAYLIKAQILSANNRDDEAVAAVELAVEKRPTDNHLRLQYARMLVQLKRYDEAWMEFQQLREAMPENHNILLSLGLLSIETGKMDLAKEYLQKLINDGSGDYQAHYYLGRIQQSQNEIMPAIANFERVLGGEYVMDARIRTAGLYAKIGRVDDALAKLKALMKQSQKDSDQIRVYLAQGEVLRAAKRHQEALEIYNLAIKDSPKNTDLLYARALIAEKLDRLDITESDLLTVLNYEPKNANALNALGYTLADKTDRLQEAKEYILKAVALLPDDPAILDSLGWVYFRLGEYENALKWLRKAFAQLEDAEIAAHLGATLWQTGKLDDAEKIWKRGLELQADNPVLLDTMKRYQDKK